MVLISSILSGLGSWLWALQTSGSLDRGEIFVKSSVLGSLLQTGVWFLWVYAVQWLVTQLFKARATFPELVRTMGYAFAPVSLTFLILIQPLAIPIGIFAFGATILLTSLAVQTSSDAHPSQAMLAAFLGFGAFLVVMGVFSNVMEVNGLGGISPGILFFSLDV